MKQNDLPIFETERLVARRWNLNLAAQSLEIYADPRVTEHIQKMHCDTEEEMTRKLEWIIERNRRWNEPFGSFPVFSKLENQLVGTALIKALPDSQGELSKDIEIGWHLGSQHWGKGYATEFGNELIRIGFDAGLSVIYAVTGLENAASQAVCRRLGMTYVGRTQEYYGQELELFEVRT